MAFKGGVVIGPVLFNGGTAQIGTDNANNAVTIGTGTTGRLINIGRSAAAHTLTIGNTNTTTSVDIASGTGNMILNSAGTNSITGTGGVSVNSTNTAMTLNSGTGNLGVSTDSSATTVSLATGAAVKTVIIGSTNTTSSLALNFGGSSGSTLSTFVDWTAWTPTIVGQTTAGTTTYGTQFGEYMRIGNLVIINFTVSCTAATGTGNINIANLPFTISNTTNYNPEGSININSATLAWPVGTTTAVLQGRTNTTACVLLGYGSVVSAQQIQMANTTMAFTGTLIYKV